MFPGRSVTRLLGALAFVVSLGALGALVPGCGTEGPDPRPAKWSFIYPAIIQPSCATASCHSDFTRRAGVNFGYSDEAYYEMICRHFVVTCPQVGDNDFCSSTPGAKIMTPPAADCVTRAVMDSQVIHQMEADGAPRMPPDFALPNVDISLIAAWIQAGAPND
jgi:hypothetical protein